MSSNGTFSKPNEYERLRAPEIASYSMYSIASTMMFSVVGSVLTYFYTDVVGINMLMVGTIMALSRVFDGVSDVIMGVLIEKTHSKLGKARCWVLWMAIPYSLAIVFLFCVPPNASQMVQAVFVFISYNFSQTVCYTAIIMATGTLSQMMTKDRDSRSSLNLALYLHESIPVGCYRLYHSLGQRYGRRSGCLYQDLLHLCRDCPGQPVYRFLWV